MKNVMKLAATQKAALERIASRAAYRHHGKQELQVRSELRIDPIIQSRARLCAYNNS